MCCSVSFLTGQCETSKNSEITFGFGILRKIPNPSIKITRIETTRKVTRIEQTSEFCGKIVYLLPGNRTYIYNKISDKETSTTLLDKNIKKHH